MKNQFLTALIIVMTFILANCEQQKTTNANKLLVSKIENDAIEIGKSELQNKQQVPIIINTPVNNESVAQRPLIQGSVADSSYEVWVIVHPMGVSDYWVQPKLTIRSNGIWKTSIYIGREGNVDAGKHFEIMAIANPSEKIEEGMKLSYWPDAEEKSEIVELIRK